MTRLERARAAFGWLDVPMSRWPLRWHVVAALCLVSAAASASYGWYYANLRAYESAKERLRLAEDRLAKARVQPVTNNEPTLPLAQPAAVDLVIRDLGEVATNRGLRLQSLKIDHELNRAGGYTEVRFSTRVSGGYVPLKAWLAELLDRHAALALTRADIRRATPDSDSLDSTIVLSLFVRDKP